MTQAVIKKAGVTVVGRPTPSAALPQSCLPLSQVSSDVYSEPAPSLRPTSKCRQKIKIHYRTPLDFRSSGSDAVVLRGINTHTLSTGVHTTYFVSYVVWRTTVDYITYRQLRKTGLFRCKPARASPCIGYVAFLAWLVFYPYDHPYDRMAFGDTFCARLIR